MAFENLKAQLAMILDEIAANPHNAHELQENVREKLAEMQAMGLPLPQDLVGLEAYLEKDLERPFSRKRPPEAAAEEPEEPIEG